MMLQLTPLPPQTTTTIDSCTPKSDLYRSVIRGAIAAPHLYARMHAYAYAYTHACTHASI